MSEGDASASVSNRNNPDPAVQEQLNRIIEKHCETIKRHVATLGAMLAAIAGGPTDAISAASEAEALAHQLKGSSGTAGFHEISRTATALDDQLKLMCRGSAEDVAFLLGKAMELFQPLDAAARDATPHTSTLYKAA
jgi:HPt (histidine-containing phosphotransfer) domain-containing protein